MEKKWEEMTPDEKQEALFQRWLSPKDPEGKDLKFQSTQAEKAYKERATRIKDAIQMKKLTDKVTVFGGSVRVSGTLAIGSSSLVLDDNALFRDPAFLDAGTCYDPLIACVDEFFEVIVRVIGNRIVKILYIDKSEFSNKRQHFSTVIEIPAE